MFKKSQNYQKATLFVDAQIKAGFLNYQELNEVVFEEYALYGELSNREVNALQKYVHSAYLNRLNEQQKWHTTSYDALQKVFTDLTENHLIVARMNYGWSQTEANQMIEKEESEKPYKGYVFFHKKDAYFLGKEEAVALSYGSFIPGAAHILAGEHIRTILESYGYTVEWDGTLSSRLKLLIPGWNKKLSTDYS